MATFTSLMRIKSPRDANGRAVTLKDLTTRVAVPSTTSVRQPFSGHPAEGLTPARLAAIHRMAANNEPERYFELAEDIEERDLHYLGVLSTRKRAVAQLPITVTEASDDPNHVKHAAFVRQWVATGVLESSLFDFGDAIGKALSIMETDWQLRHEMLQPAALTWKPQRWFTFDRTDGETVLLNEGADGKPLAAHKFIIHRHPSKSGLTIRSGLARVASWCWMYKAFTLKDWSIFCQNYGQPIRIGRYGTNATDEDKDILWRAVSQIAGDCAAIIPDGMQIEFQGVSDKASTSDLYEKRADWLDRQISKAVLGQTTTTDAVSGGHAVAREHRLVQEDIERSDAMMISATINRQLVPNLVAFNFGPQDHYPQVRIGRPDEVPLEQFAAAFASMAPYGLTAPAGWLRGRMGIPEPAADEEVIGGRGAVPGEERPPVADLSMRTLHARTDPKGDQHLMAERCAAHAGPALDGLTDQVRGAIEEATSLEDAKARLDRLNLDPALFAGAMRDAMTLSHLAGRAALRSEVDIKRQERTS